MQRSVTFIVLALDVLHRCSDPWIIAAVKNMNAPMLMCVWQELEYHTDVCHVTRGAHIEHL
jgi:hypothetical protein